jgi:hypothetical protein
VKEEFPTARALTGSSNTVLNHVFSVYVIGLNEEVYPILNFRKSNVLTNERLSFC